MGTVMGGERHELGQPVPGEWKPVRQARPRRRRRFRPTRPIRYLILIAIAVIFMAPMAYMVSASFQPLEQMFRLPPSWIPPDPTVDNYVQFFTSGRNIPRWVFNSIYVTTTITLAVVFTSSLIAYTFAKRTFPGRDFLFVLTLATLMLPTEVLGIPNYLIMKAFPLMGGNDLYGVGGHGLLNSYWGLIIPNIGSAFSIFLLRQYMKSAVPDELIDAARMDGAGHFRIYWKVVMPLCRPALAAVAIFTFQFWWQELYGPLIIIDSQELYTMPLGLTTFAQGNRTFWHLIMAGSVLMVLPIVIIFFVFQRVFVRGISLSGLKG
jgi:multiple sugar transport system permease protein